MGGRYKLAGPDEVLIVSGSKSGGKVVRNGGAFIVPIVQRMQRMSLHVISSEVKTHNAITKEGVPLTVTGTALFKIASDDAGILNAAERYLGRGREDIERDVQAVLEGHLRGVCGLLTPEEINQDRAAFQSKIAEQASAELLQMGVVLDTLTLRDISDANGYLESLGRKRIAEVQRDAAIGEAIATREASVAGSNARQQSEQAKASADTAIAESVKDRDVKIAKFQAETTSEVARAEQAAEQARAEAAQDVARAATTLAGVVTDQRRAELQAEVIAEAEARKGQAVIDATAANETAVIAANAQGQTAVIDARARSEATTLDAEAQKTATLLRAQADAEATRVRGEAVAEAEKALLLARAAGVEALGRAEAVSIETKAEALKKYSDEAMRVQMATDLIAKLPEIVGAVSSSLSAVDEIRLVNISGGSDGDPSGALLGLTPRTLAVTDEAIKQTLGMGLADLIGLIRTGAAPVK